MRNNCEASTRSRFDSKGLWIRAHEKFITGHQQIKKVGNYIGSRRNRNHQELFRTHIRKRQQYFELHVEIVKLESIIWCKICLAKIKALRK